MAAKKKRKPKPEKSSGTLGSMRSGMRRAAGSGPKKRRRKETTFGVVFGWVLGVALLIALVALLTR